MAAAPDTDELASTLAAVSAVEGWLTDAQARRLWNAAGRAPAGGRIVEIGSFRGRSTIVLARGSAGDVEVVAIDPHGGGDRGPQEISPEAERGHADNAAFVANLSDAGVAHRVRHVRTRSSEALGDVAGGIDVLYVDGAHRFRPAYDDVRQWGDRVVDGGTLLVHDAFNAVGVTLALLRLLVAGDRFAYLGRSGSLAEYRRQPVHGVARVVNTARQLAQLPYFVRSVSVKVALTVHAWPVARALGHPSRDWPY